MGLVLPVLASFLVSYLDDSGRVSRGQAASGTGSTWPAARGTGSQPANFLNRWSTWDRGQAASHQDLSD